MERKTKPVLYVVGPTKNYRDNNRTRFNKAKHQLEKAGYVAIIPHDYSKLKNSEAVETRLTLINLLPKAFGIATLEGQWFDHIASVVIATASDCGIPCRTVDKWLELAPRRQVV